LGHTNAKIRPWEALHIKKQSWLSLAILCVGVLVVWPLREHLTAEAIAARSPRQSWLAAACLLGLYAAKSLSVAFPLSALEAAGGLLFPFPAALGVNFCGIFIVQSVPFLLGRREQEGLAALAARHPRLHASALTRQPGRTVFLLRLAGATPGDLVSFYLGAAGIPWQAYLTGGLAGGFPRMVAATLLGSALWEVGSSRFWLSLLPGGILTGLSLLLWRFWR